MSARAAVATLVGSDVQIQALGFTNSEILASNATDTPNRTKYFIVIRWEEVPRTVAKRGPNVVTIWVHAPKELTRDYGLIDATIIRLKELMESAVHVAGSDGWILSEATWNGSSGDLFDDGYNSLCRWARFRCACRETP